MTTKKMLNDIGKSTFVKYYYNFKNHSRAYCISNIEENYTDKSKGTRTSKAQTIFSSNLEKEALNIIINSNRLDSAIRTQAKDILLNEFS